MITAVATYRGRCLSELELTGITTDPQVIAKVVKLLRGEEPHLVEEPVTPSRRRQSSLRMVRVDSHGT
jgi:hypothetical protein